MNARSGSDARFLEGLPAAFCDRYVQKANHRIQRLEGSDDLSVKLGSGGDAWIELPGCQELLVPQQVVGGVVPRETARRTRQSFPFKISKQSSERAVSQYPAEFGVVRGDVLSQRKQIRR